jgi:ADP-ribose pyrophosphatase
VAIVFEGRVFSVDVETVRMPDGREYRLEIVRHRPSVVLLPMPDDDHVILVRQYRPSVHRDLWELPAGSTNAGESAESAAARECEEEIVLVPGRIERLRSVFPAPGFCDEEAGLLPPSRTCGRRRPIRRTSPTRTRTSTPRLSIAEAKAMVARGDIVDPETAHGLDADLNVSQFPSHPALMASSIVATWIATVSSTFRA